MSKLWTLARGSQLSKPQDTLENQATRYRIGDDFKVVEI